VETNSDVHLQVTWFTSSGLGLDLKNLVLFTSLSVVGDGDE